MYGQLVNILSHFLAKVIIESAIFRDTSQLITSTLIDYLEWNLISFEIGIIRLQRLIFDNVISSIESPLLSNNPTKFVFHHSPSLREEDSEIPQLGIRRDPSIDSKKKLEVKSSPTTSAKNNFHRSTTRSSSFGIDLSRKLERRSSDFRGQRGGGWNLTAEVKVAR